MSITEHPTYMKNEREKERLQARGGIRDDKKNNEKESGTKVSRYGEKIHIDSQFSIESSIERSLKVRCVIDDGRKKSKIKHDSKGKMVDSQTQLIRESGCIICHVNATGKFPVEYT